MTNYLIFAYYVVANLPYSGSELFSGAILVSERGEGCVATFQGIHTTSC